ncbi:hypothetical protein CFBP1159_22020 [Xanthomonas arboricola pv. corylina]|uniref:Uncharacterized protein n=1 Tax=Xanthomonas arboricola pv. corylina TaxID=487821 RepID=A0A8D6V3G3_9XANT|nr:hypothetical protein [Xanthomonas arboricola]CAE6772668.1 hypothetical protein CFBP1159_22020 [Xanthomonas arboricola pv. corylina]CAE6772689.1 hypothetical protein CFBP1159_22020 [Xanthomonas arboricola pv. corylina]
MCIRIERPRPHLLQQSRRIGDVAQRYPKRHHVHEKADQRFDFRPLPVRDRGADHDFFLATQPRHQHRPRTQQGHEQGCTLTLGHRAQGAGERIRQGERYGSALVALPGRPRQVERQVKQHRRVLQLLPPERQLSLQRHSLQTLALPLGVVRILYCQSRQRIRQPLSDGRVERADLADDHTDRPTVGDDVVLRQQQHMVLVRQPQQLAADERSGRQFEAPQCFTPTALIHDRGLRTGRHANQIDVLQRDPHIHRRELLCQAVLGLHESGAKALMPGDDTVQCRLQRRHIQAPLQPQRSRNVIRHARGRIKPIEEPQPLLRRRAWEHAFPIQRAQGSVLLRRVPRSLTRSPARFARTAWRSSWSVSSCVFIAVLHAQDREQLSFRH